MPDEIKTPMPLFVAGTPQEAAKVQAAGFECVVPNDGRELGVAQRARDEERAVVSLMNAYANQFMQACCDSEGVPCFCSSTAVNDPAELMEIATTAAVEAGARRAEAGKKRLEQMGVYTTKAVVDLVRQGVTSRVHVATGFKSLDVALGGGLLEGSLVTLGAVMSTGKTTLALQVADHIARYRNRHVLFVTIEQGRAELVAKSLSRIIGEAYLKGEGKVSMWAASMLNAKARAKWSQEQRETFDQACQTYGQAIGPRMWMLECEEQPTTAAIAQAAQAVRDVTDEAPLVFVDYLQLIAPAEERMTERQAIDHNVMDLRHLARDMRTCVFVISSLNRASYSGGVSIDSFKESGAIEYGSDVLMGLQPRGMDSALEDVAEARQKKTANKLMEDHKKGKVREVELKVLKNRHWSLPEQPVPLVFDAAASLFTEDMAPGRPRPRKVK